MAAYLETLLSDVRSGILAAAADATLTANGVYTANHVRKVPWGELPVPYAAIVWDTEESDEWAADSSTYDAVLDLYLVYAVAGDPANLRAKAEAVRSYFFSGERLSAGTTLRVSRVSTQDDLEPNALLRDDPNRLAALVRLECVVGEY